MAAGAAAVAAAAVATAAMAAGHVAQQAQQAQQGHKAGSNGWQATRHGQKTAVSNRQPVATQQSASTYNQHPGAPGIINNSRCNRSCRRSGSAPCECCRVIGSIQQLLVAGGQSAAEAADAAALALVAALDSHAAALDGHKPDSFQIH